MSDKPEVKDTTKVQKGERNNQGAKGGEGKTENKGERRPPNRNYRNAGQKYYNKKDNKEESKENQEAPKTGDTNTNENQQNNGGEKKRRKQYKEKVVITLDTVIPELPKKGDRLKEPDAKFYDAEYERLQKEIDAIYVKMQDMIKTERQKLGLTTKESYAEQKNLRDMLKAKQEEVKKVQGELTALNEQMNEIKTALEEYYDKSNKYRQKMKILMPRDKMEAELKRLKDIQSKGSISVFEEKKIVREIGDLESSIPHAGPLEQLETQFADWKQKKRQLGGEMKKKIELRDRLKAETADIRKLLDAKKEEGTKAIDEKVPAIDKIREDYRAQINDLKQKTRDLEKKERDEWDRYYEQQELVQQVTWMKKVQDRLKRDHERKQREEEERKLREEEEAAYKEVPFKEEIDLCELLISYCNKLLPQTHTVEEAQTKDKSVILQEALKSSEWQKEKVQLIVSKRDREEDYFPGKQKKNKQQKQQQPQDTSNLALNHQIEILNYFDHVKVSPPTIVNKLQDTIKLLKEKKDYFQTQSQLEQNQTTTPAQKTDKEETKANDEPAQHKPKKYTKPYELKEEDFPSIKLQ